MKTLFGKIKKYLPNNKLAGAAIWGTIGAVAAGIIGYLMFANDQKSDKKC